MDLRVMTVFVVLEAGLLVGLPRLIWTTARLFKLGRFRDGGVH